MVLRRGDYGSRLDADYSDCQVGVESLVVDDIDELVEHVNRELDREAVRMSAVFQAPAILTRIAYLKDGGLSLGFSTQELSAEEKVTASEYFQTFGYLLFKANEFKETEVPASDATDESKSPAQRLRATLFVLWKQRGGKGDFESFYRSNMELAIERVKKLLD